MKAVMNVLVRTARGIRLVTVVALEAVCVAALVALGHRPELRVPLGRLGPWLADAPPADSVVALLRWVALVGAVWVLGSTLLYLAAAMSRVPAAMRATRWTTLPAIRRVVDAAVAVSAVSLVSGVVLAPTGAGAAGAADPPAVTVVRDGRSGHGLDRPGIAQLPADNTTGTSSTTSTTSMPPAPPPAVDVVVAPGDNLWELAARYLAATSGRVRADVPDAEIAPYWVRVCDGNRARLESGDPNLVYPGEDVTLPPLT